MSEGESAEQLRARLQSIDPYEFEHFVADLWADRGWKTTVSDGSRDVGVDIEARKLEGMVDQKAVIQAKRYSEGNKVGRPKVQQYHSMKEQDSEADVAVVVTTSEFTTDAQLWGMENNVKLVDGDDLVGMIQQHDQMDILDEYAPPPETDDDDSTSGFADSFREGYSKTGPSTDSTASESGGGGGSTSTTKDQGAASHQTDFWAIAVYAFYIQIAGFVLMFFPEFVPILTETALAGIAVLALFVSPFAVFFDANELHLKGASYRPNRIIWPAFSFMVPVIGLYFYLQKRSSAAS